MKKTTIEQLQAIITHKINNHQQYEDSQSHHSLRVIDDVVFILGEICGIAIIHDDYVWGDEEQTHYLCVELVEDDDYWDVCNGVRKFDPGWLKDHEQVMRDADEYYQKEIVPTLKS